MRDFSEKTAYIVGGSSGIGLSIASALSRKGAHVVIFARRKDRLDSCLPQIESCAVSESQRFSCIQVAVSDKDEVEAIMSRAVSEFGTPQVLINCVGRARPLYFEDVTYEQFDETMKTSLYGAWNTISALLPHMKERGGYIVNVSSMAGLIGVFGYTDYSASKFALIGFSEAIRSELKRYGIIVSVLCPPDTDTPGLQEENRTKPPETKAIAARAKLMQPDEVARALIKGMERGKFVIIPGFDGKLTFVSKRLFPGLVDFMMSRDIRKAQDGKS